MSARARLPSPHEVHAEAGAREVEADDLGDGRLVLHHDDQPADLGDGRHGPRVGIARPPNVRIRFGILGLRGWLWSYAVRRTRC